VKAVRVLIVDDSALTRKLLTEILRSAPNVDVVGTAVDAFDARDQIKRLAPDLLTLDIEMPGMNGLTFLDNLMRLRPMPVLMLSSLTARGTDATLNALELGAVDFIPKPRLSGIEELEEFRDELIEKVHLAARAHLPSVRQNSALETAVSAGVCANVRDAERQIIAVGASTGGVEAIKELLQNLPPDTPGIVIAQHIPPLFSASLAKRLNRTTPWTVSEASNGQPVLPGHAIIAPGDRHLRVYRSDRDFHCRVGRDEPVSRHRPSVDVLFDSVADAAGRDAIGVILTGMGADGAAGMRRLHEAGGRTIAQDEASSVIWGMPGEAIRHGGVDTILPLKDIPAALKRLCLQYEQRLRLTPAPVE